MTISDISDLTGIDPQIVRNWITNGVIEPAVRSGRGRGWVNRFTVMQTVGILVAVKLQQSERGCVPSYFAKVYECFSAVSEKWLREQFKKNRTHFVAAHPDGPVLRPGKYDWVDVKAAYEAVQALVVETNRQLVEVGQ